MLAGVVSEQGQALVTRQLRTHPASYLEDLTELVGAMVDEAAALGESTTSIGVGTTGLVDRQQGVLQSSMMLGLEQVPIVDTLINANALPVFLDNDVHAAALGEIRFGIGRDHDDFVVVNAGTGLAAGLVFGGRLYRGASNIAGEIGHMSVDQHGPRCACGLNGCLEDLMRQTRRTEDLPSVVWSSNIGPAPEPGLAYLALGMVNLVNLINPSAVVLVGGRLTANAVAVNWLTRAVREASLQRAAAALTHFGVSESGALAGLLGAAALAFDGMKQERGLEIHA